MPLKLVAGRERIYFEHFWNDFAVDRKHSVREDDRQFYAASYAQPGGMRAGFSYFKSFEADARDFAKLSQTKLQMPMLVFDRAARVRNVFDRSGPLVAENVEVHVIGGSCHWLVEEAPAQVIPQITAFLDKNR